MIRRIASKLKGIMFGYSNIPAIDNVLGKFVVLGEGSIFDLNNIAVVKNHKLNINHLVIGRGCHISGNFLFEDENARVSIGDNTYIGASTIHCLRNINIGNNVMISWGCTIIDNSAHSLSSNLRRQDMEDFIKGLSEGEYRKFKNWDVVPGADITICDDAWISFNSIILKGVTIGKGAIVGAGSVVTKDVPDFTIVAGNPAKIVGTSS